MKRAEIDSGRRPGTSTADAQRIAQLERENKQLRRANDILKAAPVFGLSCSIRGSDLSGCSSARRSLLGFPAVQRLVSEAEETGSTR